MGDQPNKKIWYSTRELAQEWGISEGWIRDHATRKQPRINGKKFGKSLRFHVDDIKTFLDQIDTSRNNAA